MSDLSGKDAFEKVLEQLLDAHFNARQATEGRRDAELRAQRAEQQSTILRDNASRLELAQKNGLPKLCELWNAARAVLDFPAPKNIASAELMKRLRIALEAAADYCDQIPF